MNEPARWGLRRRVLDVLDKLQLARPAVQVYELLRAGRSRLSGRVEDADGIPLPPALLRAQVGPLHADAAFFLESGRKHAELIRGLLHENGTSIEELDTILDWGCGCGRVLRHWAGLPETRLCGCDINPKMVEWCVDHLAIAEVVVNDITPPFPYPDSSFDLVYGLSVITHLSEELQYAWIQECLRVLKPQGYLLFTTLGEYYVSRERLNSAELTSFANGELVVLYEDSSGTSLCSAYHPPQYVHERLCANFDLAAFRPASAEGGHDFHLFRKPASVPAALLESR